MGTISAREAVDQASILLEDQSKKQFTDEELLRWLNAGQLAIVGLRPDAKSAIASVQLVEGTKQTIIAPNLRVLDVVRNMGSGGATPGRAIRKVDRAQLDLEDPNWHAATANVVVRQWAYDDRLPRVWWCYPPQTSSPEQVEIVTSQTPTDCTLQNIGGEIADSTIDIDDIYFPALVNYIVYRAFSKDSEYTQPGGKAQMAQQDFYQSLGLNLESDKRFRPDQSEPPKHLAAPPGNQGAFGNG